MKMKKRSALIAMAGWLAIVVGVFAYAMLSGESESASPTGPDPRVTRPTVPRTTQPSEGPSLLVQTEPSTEAPVEVLGEVQLPVSGFSLFRVGPRAVNVPAFVLPEFFALYVGPGFVFTQPDTPGTTVPPRPLDPPTTTVPPTTAPPTTEPPTTEPPTTAPPTTEPPTTAPPTTEPPTTVPPDTLPPDTLPPDTLPPEWTPVP